MNKNKIEFTDKEFDEFLEQAFQKQNNSNDNINFQPITNPASDIRFSLKKGHKAEVDPNLLSIEKREELRKQFAELDSRNKFWNKNYIGALIIGLVIIGIVLFNVLSRPNNNQKIDDSQKITTVPISPKVEISGIKEKIKQEPLVFTTFKKSYQVKKRTAYGYAEQTQQLLDVTFQIYDSTNAAKLLSENTKINLNAYTFGIEKRKLVLKIASNNSKNVIDKFEVFQHLESFYISYGKEFYEIKSSGTFIPLSKCLDTKQLDVLQKIRLQN